MDKNYFVNEYLQGRHPIDKKSWELPSESELDRDEALYEALLAERKHSPLLWRGWGRLCFAAAAVLVAVFALFTWKAYTPNHTTGRVETTEVLASSEDTSSETIKRDTSQRQTRHVAMANATRRNGKRDTSRPEKPQHELPETHIQSTDAPVLSNAADSLYYYLTQLENQMGDCRDSTCFAELGNLIQADERIKGLVQKIIHKQVETAYQEEYLVDTTTRYIPL